MLRIIFQLEDPVVTKFELSGRCLEVLLQYFSITLHTHDFIYFLKCTSAFSSKRPAQYDAATIVLYSVLL